MEHLFVVAWQKIKLASAKKRREIFGPLAHAATPFNTPYSADLRRSVNKPSAHNKNKYGDKGSRWSKPPSRGNIALRLSINLYSICYKLYTSHYNFTPMCMKAHLQHNFFQTPSFDPIISLTYIKFESQLPPLFHFFFLGLIWCIILKATRTLSMIRPLFIKALWFSLMIFGNKSFNLLARTYEASLKTTLLRLMGL